MDVTNFDSGSPSLANAICQCVCASAPKVNKIQHKLTTTAKPPYCNYPMEHSPTGKVNVHSATQEIPCILRHPNVHNRDHNRPSLTPIPSPNCNILYLSGPFKRHPSSPWSSKLPTFFRCSYQHMARTVLRSDACHMFNPPHPH